MTRLLGFVLLVTMTGGIMAWAQDDEESDHFGISVAGFAGAGVGQTLASSSGGGSNNTLDHFTDLGITTKGYLYDPRLVGFYGTVENGLSDSGGSNLVSYSTRDWNYYGGLNFFPERPFPFTIFASRSNTNTYNSLFPAVQNTLTTWGINGTLTENPIGRMGYSFTKSTTDQEAPGLPNSRTRYLHGAYTLGKKIDDWDLHFSDDYWSIVNPFFVQSNNTTVSQETTNKFNDIQGNAVRQFGDNQRLSLQVLDVTSSTTQPGSTPADSSSVFVSGNYSWRITDKLDTGYGGFYQRDHVSAVNILNTIGGPGTTTVPSFEDSVTSGDARLNYRPTSHLSFVGGMDYFHNDYGNEQFQSSQAALTAQDLLTTRGGYIYRWDTRKLHWTNSAELIWQHYVLVNGNTDSALGYEIRQGVDGGQNATLKYHFGVRFVDQSNPIFFQYVRTHTEGVDANLSTAHFSWIHFGLNGNLMFNQYDLANGTQDGKAETAGANADFPNKNLGLFGMYSHANGTQRFFNALPGIGNPAQPLPPPLLNAYDLLRFGASWSRHNNLKVASYYNRIKYAFAFTNTTITTDASWDTLVEYLFGRFTFNVGYSRELYSVQPTSTNLNRWFVRVRFPFHLWQRG